MERFSRVSSQYRNKTSFYLFTEIPSQYGFKTATWNYLESGHGKGAADGVGAVVKRLADRIVSHGKDVTDASTMFNELSTQKSSIAFFYVTDEDISAVTKTVPSDLKSYPGTMLVHQVSQGEMVFRRSVGLLQV